MLEVTLPLGGGEPEAVEFGHCRRRGMAVVAGEHGPVMPGLIELCRRTAPLALIGGGKAYHDTHGNTSNRHQAMIRAFNTLSAYLQMYSHSLTKPLQLS